MKLEDGLGLVVVGCVCVCVCVCGGDEVLVEVLVRVDGLLREG